MTQRDTWRQYWRLSALSVAIALLAAFVLLAGEFWFEERAEVLEELKVQSAMIGTNAGAALAFKDAETATEILSALARSPMVIEAALYLADGRRLAVFRRAGEKAGYLPAHVQNVVATAAIGEIRLTLPVLQQGRSIGTMALRADMSRVHATLGHFVVAFAVVAAIAGVLAYLAGHGIRLRLMESQSALESSRSTIRLLSAHRESVMEAEHKRIAQEIHDELGQLLTTALLNLKRIERSSRSGNSVSAEQVAEIKLLIEDALRGVRGIAADLRPPVLNIGLPAAIEWLAERTLNGSDIALRIEMAESLPGMDDRCSITLFRIVQESLTNIVRHAHAQSVHIALASDGESLRLLIEDDGVGFVPQVPPPGTGFGLIGMQERVSAIGGSVEIDSRPSAGTRIRVRVPLSTTKEN
ncbi:MAG: histidine kinase [Rhodocyclaceae bacterium]|nr:histidine kinase [Rhodocyclaceae bacterium]